jgi:ribonuclease BN (tRNA processing enzyme)
VKLTVVGCSGSVPGPASPASCYLVEHDGFRLVLDLGHGSLGALQRYLTLPSIDAVVLSHLHADHCIDLTALHVAHQYGNLGFKEPLPVYGPAATAERIASGYGMSSTQPLQASFVFREVAAAASIGPFRVRAERVAHPIEAYGIRLEAGGASLVYSGDTGPCRALDELASGTDVLLAEASFVHGRENPRDLHMTGREAGQVASNAGAGRLVVTHVPPWHNAATAASEAAEVFAGTIDIATAGLTVDVGR